MNILITGGAGFQGSHLTEYLRDRGHVITILNTRSTYAEANMTTLGDTVEVYWGDVRDRTMVDQCVREKDVVFHLAGNINVDQSLEDPLLFFNNNILGTYNVLEAVKTHGPRLIFVSTCEVYGDGHDPKESHMLKETTELRPNSPYAASKAAADRMCYAYYKSYGVPLTIVRPFNIFGERQKSGTFGALIPILVSRALKGNPITIFGDGSAARDYLHISDMIQGYNLILENNQLNGQVVNFASGNNVTVNEIATYIAKKLGVDVVYGPARPGEVSRLPADISFAKSLGFVPKMSIWEGIDRYIDWMKQYGNLV